MENNTNVFEMLKETTEKLDQIKELNKEINSALDVIETRRNKQQTADNSCKEVTGGDEEFKSLEGETTPNTATSPERCTEDVHPTESKPSERCIDGVQSQDVSPSKRSTEDVQPPENNECSEKTPGGDKQNTTTVKGILKEPKMGSKDSYGFKERLDLQFNHVMFGSKLKRSVVEMNQDNRLCQEFGLEPNFGSIYESRRSPSPDVQHMTAPTLEVTVNNLNNKHVSLNERDDNVSKKSTTNEKQASSSEMSSESHSKATSTSTAVTVKREEKMKKHQKGSRKRSSKHSDMTVEVSSKTGETEGQPIQNKQMAVVMEALQNRGDPLQLSRDVWINTMVDMAKVDDEQKQELRKYFGAFIDAFFGKGSIVNVADFMNITKEKYVEKMLEMYSVDENLSEDEKQEAAELVANTFFNENGQIDFQKCLQEGGQLMNLGYQQLQSALGQTSETTESSNDSDTEDEPLKPSFQNSAVMLTRATELNETDDNDSEVERIDINPDLWVQYANDEVKNGKVAQDVRESGMDTVICLDISQSMRGYAWEQATLFIKNFVEGIQNSTLMDASFEHIALVTYGSETRVQQHLTCDYVEIIRKLDRLKPSGPSPMYAGLQMVHAAIIGAGMIFKCNGYRIYPRVFLITDGKFTPAGMISGPDRCQPELLLQEQIPILRVVKEIHDKYHVTFNPVPVGEFDTTVLERIIHISKGKMISSEDWRSQSSVFKNYLAAAKLCGGPFAKMLEPGLRKMMIDAVNACPEDKIQMEEFLRTHDMEDGDNDSDYEADNFPPLGSRVRGHNPGSTITTESNQALGTITKHFSDGHIGITWDEMNADGQIREKRRYQPGDRSVIVVDEPRILIDQMIAEGCRVKRGKEWGYADQDGGKGNLGSVYGVKPNGIVSVRWDNGNKNTYRYGAEGKFELEIVGQTKEITKKAVHIDKPVIAANDLTEEMKVQMMNERNISIYDIEMSKSSAGASSRSYGDNSDMHSKNKNNMSLTQTVHSDENKMGETNESGHVTETISSNDENNTVSTVRHSSEDITNNTGAKPKKLKPLGESAENKAEWRWLDDETWRLYPPDIIEKIESGYKRNPRGTTVIRLNDIMYLFYLDITTMT